MAEGRGLRRTGSFSGVWWKLGDDADAVRLRDEEAAVKACIQRRRRGARAVRRTIAFTSLALEALYALWLRAATRPRPTTTTTMNTKAKLLLLLLPLSAIPSLAAIVLTAFARFHRSFDARDQQKLQRLAAERKASNSIRGSHHNMQNLIHVQKHDPDAAEPAAATPLKRTHSRLSFHVGDE